MHEAMGALFYRGASPTEIEAMSWERIRYWHSWHKVMEGAEKAAAEAARKAAQQRRGRA